MQDLQEAERLLNEALPIIQAAQECGIDVGMHASAQQYYLDKIQKIRKHFGPVLQANPAARQG